jgi:PBP1b-binding outer membrane lipoprotein LpoB
MKRLIIFTSVFSVLAMMLVSCASQPATTETTTRQATISTAPTPISQSPQLPQTAPTIGGAY